jgi:hypothetical protein
MLPPPQFDHPPEIPVIEHVLTSDAINRICHERHAMDMVGRPASPAYRFSGCAHLSVTTTGKSCEVWRIDDGTVRRHEFGHCNGWPADHPDAAASAPRIAVDAARTFKPAVPQAAIVTSVKVAPATLSVAPAGPPTISVDVKGVTVKLAPWPIRDADIDRVPLDKLPPE